MRVQVIPLRIDPPATILEPVVGSQPWALPGNVLGKVQAAGHEPDPFVWQSVHLVKVPWQ